MPSKHALITRNVMDVKRFYLIRILRAKKNINIIISMSVLWCFKVKI